MTASVEQQDLLRININAIGCTRENANFGAGSRQQMAGTSAVALASSRCAVMMVRPEPWSRQSRSDPSDH